MIAWGPRYQGPVPEETHDTLEEVLEGHAWGRAFPGVYVLALTYEGEREQLIDALADAAREADGEISVLVSPPVDPGAGLYNGWLPNSHWDGINKRTT